MLISVEAIKNFGKDFPSTYNIPRRELGKTGEKLSVLGFGGIMLNDNPQEFANEMVAKAFELGVNYFDVAPKYGNAEDRLGPALKPFRKNCFLACKTRERDAAGAQKNLDDSFKKLQTDYFDLYQLHELSSIEEVEQVFSPGGAMETLIKAKKEGKIKHIGFSAHHVGAALLAMKKYDFDSILVPINFACWNAGNFGPQIYIEAEKRGMGILALKAMALTTFNQGEDLIYKNCWYKPIDDEAIMKMALKYTLSKNVTAAIPPGDVSLFMKALEFMHDFSSISDEETQQLVKLAKNTRPVFVHE
ncbi:aldo/keto reductase [Prolixibacteraceae bacterium Z1-6]|uniref:Aldo/keto reductase n=1 Tax=Draconibacterium aestuarii TaxID=2998507 RepID=A0A9X3F5L6_9BACT|nr:aldo/keto reductase [Prolixibacteraceae bacterium Z1-6]